MRRSRFLVSAPPLFVKAASLKNREALNQAFTRVAEQHHVIGSDAWDLFVATGDRASLIDEDDMHLSELRAAMESHGPAWSRLPAQDLDPDAVLDEVDEDDGYERNIAMGIELAQALHHGTDHRSQVCTVLTALGVEPPPVDVLDFGIQEGRVVGITPAS